MSAKRNLEVAVLLATYNGSRYVGSQIHSLKDNTTPFTLHWLDDHSTDNTIEATRASARNDGLNLREWHQSEHLGIPSSFFRLLECVEADIYLFCDQDDIWQPGKLDATVVSLLPDISLPALCFTDLFMFDDNQPGELRSRFDFGPTGKLARLVEQSPTFAFMPGCPTAQTQGFTRPLRDIFLRHKQTACAYALMHDWWMYDIAIASGTVRMLPNAPKAIYRCHQDSFGATVSRMNGNWLMRTWKWDQLLRRLASRHAQGLIIASPTLPPGRPLDRMLEFAQLVAPVDRRQSAAAVLRLLRLGFMRMRSRMSMAVNCLCSDATI